MNCPHCSGVLVPESLKSIIIDKCDSCSGVWFDAGELEAFKSAVTGKSYSYQILDNFSPNEELDADYCPHCKDQTLEIGSIKTYVIRACYQCSGIFISASELKQLSKSNIRKTTEDTAVSIAAEAGLEGGSWIAGAIFEFLFGSLG